MSCGFDYNILSYFWALINPQKLPMAFFWHQKSLGKDFAIGDNYSTHGS